MIRWLFALAAIQSCSAGKALEGCVYALLALAWAVVETREGK